MTSSIFLVILITSLATYVSRFFGVISSERIEETSKIFRWFNCLAYSTLAALIARMIVFPVGELNETTYSIRFIVILLAILGKTIKNKIKNNFLILTCLLINQLHHEIYISSSDIFITLSNAFYTK